MYDMCFFICDAWVYTSNVSLMFILCVLQAFFGLYALIMGDSEGIDKIEKEM